MFLWAPFLSIFLFLLFLLALPLALLPGTTRKPQRLPRGVTADEDPNLCVGRDAGGNSEATRNL